MKCVICKHGETHSGRATLSFMRDGTTLVVKGVAADICANCGEEYVDEATTARLLHEAEEAARAGVKADVRDYVSGS